MEMRARLARKLSLVMAKLKTQEKPESAFFRFVSHLDHCRNMGQLNLDTKFK